MLNLLRLIFDREARARFSLTRMFRNIGTVSMLFGFIAVSTYFFTRSELLLPQDPGTIRIVIGGVLALAALIAIYHMRTRHPSDAETQFLPIAVLLCLASALALVPAASGNTGIVREQANAVPFEGTIEQVIANYSKRGSAYGVDLLVRAGNGVELSLSVPNRYADRLKNPGANETMLRAQEMLATTSAVDDEWLGIWLAPGVLDAPAAGRYNTSSLEITDLSVAGKPMFSHEETLSNSAETDKFFTYLSQGILVGVFLMLLQYIRRQPRLQIQG